MEDIQRADGERLTPRRMTEMRIEKYRDAANGLVDIHVFSYNGEPKVEINKPSGEPLDASDRCIGNYGRDSSGSEVELDYDGIMSPEDCLALAASLEAQLVD